MPSRLGNPNHGNQGQPYEDDAYSDRNHGKILPVPKTTERAFEREERRPCAFRPASPRAQEEHTCACDKPQFDDCEEPWRKSSIEIRQHGQGKHSVVHRQTLKKFSPAEGQGRPTATIYFPAASFTPISSNNPPAIWIISSSTTRFLEMASCSGMDTILLARRAAMQPNSPRCAMSIAPRP